MPRADVPSSKLAMTVWTPADGSVIGRVTVFHFQAKVKVEVLGRVECADDAGVPGGVIAECGCVQMAGTGLSREEACRDLERVIEGFLEGLLGDESLDTTLRKNGWRIADDNSAPASLRHDYVLAGAEVDAAEIRGK